MEARFDKVIYLVRHGESEGNIRDVHGHHEHALTPKGRKQARHVADRLTKLPIEVLVASTMVRARETGEIISDKISVPLELSDLFTEALVPSVMRDAPRNSPMSLEFEVAKTEHYNDPYFRFADEENYTDLKSRAVAALKFLSTHPQKHIAVVTHGFFLRALVSVAVFGQDMHNQEFHRITETFHAANTGLTVLGYDQLRSNPWWLWVWNDHAHLG